MKNELIYTVSTVSEDKPGQGFVAAQRYIEKRQSALKMAADILDMRDDPEIAQGWQMRQDHARYGYWRGLWYGEKTHDNGTRSQVVIKTPRYRWAEVLVWAGIATEVYDDAHGTIDPQRLAAALKTWRETNPGAYYEPDEDGDNDAQNALLYEEISEGFMVAIAAVAAGMIVG